MLGPDYSPEGRRIRNDGVEFNCDALAHPVLDNDHFNPFGFIQLSIVERRSILHAARATIYLAKG